MIKQILNRRYRIEELVGTGAMGEVYRARDLETDDPVAVKKVYQALVEQEEYRERFKREVLTLRKLRHPHIVYYVDAFNYEGSSFLVMEYVSGGNLSQLIRSRGILPEGLFKQIALKVIDAVATAHDFGVIHRDLKPANILLNSLGEPKIADFGLAKVLDFASMTETGTLMGTPSYMPPEAFDPLEAQDHRADIWALGVIFFEMLTGTLPFRGTNPMQIMASVLSDPPTRMNTIRKDVPNAWSSIIQHCLQKNPNGRYPSAEDLYNDLRGDICRYVTAESKKRDTGLLSSPEGDNVAAEADTEPALETQGKRTPRTAAILRGDMASSPVPPQRRTHETNPLLSNQPVTRTGWRRLVMLGEMSAWLGAIALVLSGIIAAVNTTQTEADRLVEPGVLLPVAGVGTLLLVIGLLLEIPGVIGIERAQLISMALGAGVAGGLIALGTANVVLIPAVVGIALTAAIAISYFVVKGF